MKKIFFIMLILLFSEFVWGQENRDTVQSDTLSVIQDVIDLNNNEAATKGMGDSAYIKGDYLTAIQVYESLLQQGESAEIYYNLGNSYYKSGDIAHAILNYERALLLQPENGDIRANLKIANAKTIDKITPIPEIFFITWIKSLINSLNIDTWAKLGIISFMLCLIGLGTFLYIKAIKWKKVGFIGGITLLIFAMICNIFAFQQKKNIMVRNNAIVLSPSITVRSTPSENGTSLFILHEGHKVEIKDGSMQEWKEIRLKDGKVGWLPASSIEII